MRRCTKFEANFGPSITIPLHNTRIFASYLAGEEISDDHNEINSVGIYGLVTTTATQTSTAESTLLPASAPSRCSTLGIKKIKKIETRDRANTGLTAIAAALEKS